MEAADVSDEIFAVMLFVTVAIAAGFVSMLIRRELQRNRVDGVQPKRRSANLRLREDRNPSNYNRRGQRLLLLHFILELCVLAATGYMVFNAAPK